MTKKVLVVDDEESIVTLLKYNLEQSGFNVITAMDGLEGKRLAIEQNPDVIVLDLMLPKLDGIEVCRRLREKELYVPILMLTAKDDEKDKIIGLEIGADDYMTKPFSPRELIARVKALLRRSNLQGYSNEVGINNKLKIGALTIIPDQYEVYLSGKLLQFTPKEFKLLHFLATNKNRVLTREQLMSSVWNYDFVGDTRIVDVHISRLRDKIETNTRKPVYIKTIRGLGYKFEDPGKQ